MYVCRACAKKWNGPPPWILQRAQAAGLRPRPAVRLIAQPSREAQPWTLDARRSYATAAPTTKAPNIQSDTIGEDDDRKAVSRTPRTDTAKLDAAARRQLKYFKDPFTIGKHVADTLAKNKFEEALQLTRMASKSQQVVVSWNHLIGYLLKQEKVTAAIKLFNEMKKRGQLPNAQTYTVIFRGCANSPHANMTHVYQATRLYYAMLDSDRLKPNTIHMNAVLQVCARAKDIESLFSVVKTANNRQRSPDNLTYTTILNGLRFATALPHHRPLEESRGKKGDDGGEDVVHADKENVSVSVNRARAVWAEVVDGWQHGRIQLDEELVCAMGRVLLMGGYRDNDDVLSLVEQTTGIPRLDRDRQTALPAPKATAQVSGPPGVASAAADASNDDSSLATDVSALEAAAAAEMGIQPLARPEQQDAPAKEEQITSIFSPLPQGVVGSRVPFDGDLESMEMAANRPSRIAYARPGRNLLSVVLTSLGATRKTSLASRYWEIFTTGNNQHRGYNVVPDSENWYRLLKALRRGHNSGKVAELMQKMPPELMNENTFRLAMATCAADNLNDNVFASAGKILDLMTKTLRVPDPHTLRLYLKTAMTNNRRFRQQQKEERAAEAAAAAAAARTVVGPRAGGAWGAGPRQQLLDRANNNEDKESAKFAFGRQIVRALARLWDPLRIASNATRPVEESAEDRPGGTISWTLLPPMPPPKLKYADSSAESPEGSKADDSSETEGGLYNARRELLALARQMVSAADMVVTEGMADEATIKDVRITRNLLNRQISRFYENREDLEPNLKWKGKRTRERKGGNDHASQSRGGGYDAFDHTIRDTKRAESRGQEGW